MDRSYLSNTSGSAPAAPGSPATGYPQSGNPGTGTPATRPGPYWYHMITESLRNLLVAAGLTPDQSDLTLVRKAVAKLGGQQTGCLRAVRAVSTSNITRSAPQTIDGVAVVAGNRVLVAGQTTTSENGIYVVAAGAWTRDDDTIVAGVLVPVSEGTANAGACYRLATTGSIVLGTTGLSFTNLVDVAFSKKTLAASGYQILPGGMIIQWGFPTIPSAENVDSTTTFPIAFPTSCASLVITDSANTSNNAVVWATNTINLANFLSHWARSGMTLASTTRSARYIAIGY